SYLFERKGFYMLSVATNLAVFLSEYDYSDMMNSYQLSAGYYVFSIVLYVLQAIAMMKIFEKAGITPWYAFVPILNSYMLTKIATGNGWLFLLALIPCVGSIIWLILVAVKLAPAFGYGGGMIALLILLSIVGYYVIGFGSSQYQGPQ
nr:DUF5684 domain-containing protein [Eubacterium sp.]